MSSRFPEACTRAAREASPPACGKRKNPAPSRRSKGGGSSSRSSATDAPDRPAPWARPAPQERSAVPVASPSPACVAPATGTANPAGLARRRLSAEFTQTPANGRTRHPRDLGDKPDPAPPKASRLGRRQQPTAPLVKMRSQSIVSIFDTIRVVHSQYIDDKPTLRNPPSDHPRDYSVISPKPAGIVPSSARAPGARGGLAKPGASSDVRTSWAD